MKHKNVLYQEMPARRKEWYKSIGSSILIIILLSLAGIILSYGNWTNISLTIAIGLCLIFIIPIIIFLIALNNDLKYQTFLITSDGFYPPEKHVISFNKHEFIPKENILLIKSILLNHEIVGFEINIKDGKTIIINKDVGDLNRIESILITNDFPIEAYDIHSKNQSRSNIL